MIRRGLILVSGLSRVLSVIGVLLLVIAAERFLNMLMIGRPLDSFTTRVLVYQVCAAAGISLLIVAVMLRR